MHVRRWIIVVMLCIAADQTLWADGDAASVGCAHSVTVECRPLEVLFSSPGYRANFYPGQNSDRVAGSVKSHVPGEVRLVLEGPGFPRREATLPAGGGAFSFDTRGFEVGAAVLTVAAAGKTLAKKIRRLAPLGHGHMTWIENGNLVFDGKPVFRRNMYAEYYKGGEAFRRKYDADDLHQTKDIKWIASLEPNVVVKGLERREAKRDVKPCDEYFAGLDRIIDKGLNQSDGSFYYISDEPEFRHVSPVYLRHAYEYVAERDPYHVILCGTRDGSKYIDCADWFETHPYVHQRLDENGRRVFGRGLLELGPFVDAFRADEHPDKCVGCIPTCFSYPDGVSPTFREYVTHTWNFLVHGVKSFYPYAYHDLGDTAGTYEGVRFTNMTVERLSDFFLFGRRTPLKCPAGSEGAVWELDGKRLFAVVNATFEPLEAAVPGLDGKYVEFRGPRMFDCRVAGTKFSLKPLEAIVATSESMDAGLPTYDETEMKVLAQEELRTGRDNQLKGMVGDMLVNGAAGKPVMKLVDGTLDVVAWNGHTGCDASAEIAFLKRACVFRELRLYGANIEKAKVSIRIGGEWTEPPAETETAEFSKFFRFGRALRTFKLRIDVPKPKAFQKVELYEIEMPLCREAADDSQAVAGKAASLEPQNALWKASAHVAADEALVVKAEIPQEAKWLLFELASAERANKSKYRSWNFSAVDKGKKRFLAGDVTFAQTGLYALPVGRDDLKGGLLRIRSHDYRLDIPFIAAVADPEQYMLFAEEGGKWKVTLQLKDPCEEVACSLYGSNAYRPIPYPMGEATPNVPMRPDASRRLWTGEIPAPTLAVDQEGKPMHPWAKATVLGGSLTVPVYTPLRGM